MRLMIGSLVLAIATHSVSVFCVQFGSGHKSEAEIARMTPEQRVDEYIREDLRHKYDLDDNYHDLVFNYIRRDVIRGLDPISKIIDEYNPKEIKGKTKESSERYDAAWILLSDIDGTVIRLRASEEGQRGIEAVRRAVERMQAAHFDDAESYNYNKQGRYQLSLIALKEMTGINARDEAVRHTLKLRYKISVSETDMLGFVNYMISQDPSYPSLMVTELYKDQEQLNQAGKPSRV
jgi:hypothetical protein